MQTDTAWKARKFVSTQVTQPPIFLPAASSATHAAVMDFLEFVHKAAGPYAQQRVWANEAIEKVARGEVPLAREIDYAIAVADATLFDEMRPENYGRDACEAAGWCDNAATYQRFFSDRYGFPEVVTEAIERRFATQTTRPVLGCPVHLEHLYNGLGQLGLLTPEVAYWVNAPLLLPPVGMARQTLFASLLRCGINPFARSVSHTDCQRIEGRPPRYIRKYAKIANLSARADEFDAMGFEQRTAGHWGKLLREGKSGQGKTLLFNSGVAANEAVVAAVAEAVDGPSYMHPFWYFENVKSVDRLFVGRQTTEPHPASVVFINLEPVTFHRWGEATQSPEETICDFVAKSHKAPSVSYVLVIDVTVNPLFSVRQVVGGAIPDNLCLVKTVSASKHQHGGRNGFFGVVHVDHDLLPPSTLLGRIACKRKVVGGEPSMRHQLNFPRPSAAWLQKKQQRIVAMNRSLCQCIPADSEWRLVPFTLHAYLLPPADILEEYSDLLDAICNLLDNERFQRLSKSLSYTLMSSLLGEDHYLRHPDIEIGNSFGLSTSRVYCDVSFLNSGEEQVRISGVRISPGFATDEAALQTYFCEMFTRFQQAMDEAVTKLRRRLTLCEMLIGRWRQKTESGRPLPAQTFELDWTEKQLPDGIRIVHSDCHGWGVVATRDFARGELLFHFNWQLLPWDARVRVRSDLGTKMLTRPIHSLSGKFTLERFPHLPAFFLESLANRLELDTDDMETLWKIVTNDNENLATFDGLEELLNHADDANTQTMIEAWEPGEELVSRWRCFARYDICAGEELTNDYTVFAPWFKPPSSWQS